MSTISARLGRISSRGKDRFCFEGLERLPVVSDGETTADNTTQAGGKIGNHADPANSRASVTGCDGLSYLIRVQEIAKIDSRGRAERVETPGPHIHIQKLELPVARIEFVFDSASP